MMASAQRHGELIADLAPKCAALRESEVVGVGRLSTANETGISCDKFDVIAVANPARLWQSQRALVDGLGPRAIVRISRDGWQRVPPAA